MRTDWTFLGSADQNTYIRETKKFWNHEWMKHGYCAKDFIGSDQPKPYFEKALELYRSEDLLGRLTSSGIEPRDDKTYQEYEIIQAFTTETPFVRPILSCRAMNRRTYLSEISICFDQNLKAIDCESGGSNVCPKGAITYPLT
ncbi:RNT2 Ribonuclease, partial [Polyodon spathula]|nr:RNT2 Ribonuclease [Polyodon spathula]